MRFAHRTEALGGRGADAWKIHDRAEAMAASGRDVIFLSVGDPDFASPAPAVEKAVEALRAGNTKYTPISGTPRLRQAIADHHRRQDGCTVDPGDVVVFPGAQAALFAVVQCLADPGDEVIVPQPKYVTYDAVLGAAGAVQVPVPLDVERGFALDLDAIARAITPRTRALLVTTPHNPTGAVVPPEDWAQLGELARGHDFWVVSDEVYGAVTFDRPHASAAAEPSLQERTVVVSSLSKSHAMTGWRMGWAFGPKPLAAHLARLTLCMLYGSPGFIQAGAVAALEEAGGQSAAMREAYRDRRDLLVSALDGKAGLRVTPPAGGMFVMADIRATGLDAQHFAERLLEAEAVSVLPGGAFGAGGEGFVRISLAASPARLEEAAARILRVARSLA